MSALHRPQRKDESGKDARVCRAPLPPNMLRGIGDSQAGLNVRLIPPTSLSSGSCRLRTDTADRKHSLAELARSIAASGIIEPIIVRPEQDGTFEVVVGERRLMAAKILKLPEIPCIVRACSRSEALMMSLTENLQRSDLSAIEKAEGLRKLLNDFHLTQEEIGKRIGVSQSAIAHHLRLLLLPPEIQRHIQQGILSMGHGKLLAGIADPKLAVDLALKCAAESWSVRQLEESLTHTPEATKGRHARRDGTKKRSERELPNGVFLIIKESVTDPTCGTIEIPYYSPEEKHWVMATLSQAHDINRQTPRRRNAAPAYLPRSRAETRQPV